MNRLAALAAVAVLASAAFAETPSDPRVAQAVRQLREGSDDDQLKAIRTIRDLGPDGAPAVAALTEALKDGAPARRTEIVKVLAALGPAAKESIPTLVAIAYEPRVDHVLFAEAVNAVAALGDAGNREIVTLCLFHENHGRGGKYISTSFPDYLAKHAPATLPVMADLLTDPNRLTRQRAAISLANLFAPPAENKTAVRPQISAATRDRVVPALRAALDDPDLRTRSWAAAALLDADPSAVDVAVPALLTAARKGETTHHEVASLLRSGAAGARVVVDYLDEPNPSAQRTFAGYLAQFGEPSLPVLADGLRHPSPRVRAGVIQAIRDSGRVARLRSGVTARLADQDEKVRVRAAAALTTVEPNRAGAAVPVLAELVFSRDRDVRAEALAALEGLGAVARPAVPALLRRLRSGNFDTRLATAEALQSADRSAWRTYVPVFVAALKSDQGSHRTRALHRLRDTGPDARAALPAVRPFFTDDDPMVRVLAAEAAFRIDPATATEAVACLTGVLNDYPAGARRNYRHWRNVIRVLETMGPAAKPAVPALVEAIRLDPEAGYAPEAGVLAIRLDPDHAGDVYDLFRNELNPGNPNPDDEWLDRLPKLGKLAKPLVPDLIAALGSKHDEQVAFAIETLIVLGRDAKDAVPALRELAKGKKEPERVAKAIAAIEKR
jgi:HEAT repeat protein